MGLIVVHLLIIIQQQLYNLLVTIENAGIVERRAALAIKLQGVTARRNQVVNHVEGLVAEAVVEGGPQELVLQVQLLFALEKCLKGFNCFLKAWQVIHENSLKNGVADETL